MRLASLASSHIYTHTHMLVSTDLQYDEISSCSFWLAHSALGRRQPHYTTTLANLNFKFSSLSLFVWYAGCVTPPLSLFLSFSIYAHTHPLSLADCICDLTSPVTSPSLPLLIMLAPKLTNWSEKKARQREFCLLYRVMLLFITNTFCFLSNVTSRK